MAKAPAPRNPAGSSVPDMLRSKYTKKIPDAKLRHGAKAQDIEGVRHGMNTAADLMFHNEDTAYHNYDQKISDMGWQAGGGSTDILGDGKGPPVPTKKIPDQPGSKVPLPNKKPRLDTGYAAQMKPKKIPPYQKPPKPDSKIPPMSPPKKPSVIRTGLKTYSQQVG